MCLQKIKPLFSLFLLFLLTLGGTTSYAIDSKDSYSVFEDPAIESGPLYSSVDEIFSAYHNKLIYSLFGSENFKSFISVQTSPEVMIELAEVVSSGDALINSYIAPFSTSITSVIYVMVMAFYSVAIVYIFFINGKFYFEKIYTAQSTHFKKSVNSFKSVGGNHFLRAITSIIVVTPVLPVLISVVKGEDIGEIEGTPFTGLVFRALGTSFEYTERISRLFIGDSSMYEPYYQVPAPDVLEGQFQKINAFTTCVTSKKVVGEVILKSEVTELQEGNLDFANTLSYKILLGECNLNITVDVDNEMLKSLAVEEIEDITSMTTKKYMDRIKSIFKKELDSYVVQSISVAKHLSDIYFAKTDPDKSFKNTISLKFPSDWYKKCDETLDVGLNGEFGPALVAYKKLPKCWSRSYVKAFAYPTTVTPDQLDSVPSTRFSSVCNKLNLGDHDVESMAKDALISCIRDVCKDREGDVYGIFQCSVTVSNLRRIEGIEKSAIGGFFFAPAYTYLQYSAEINDSSKKIINTLSASSNELSYSPTDEGDLFVTSASGEELYRYKQANDRVEVKSNFRAVMLEERGTRIDESSFFSSITGDPTALIMYYINRFNTCQTLKDSYSAIYGPCGTTYQELNRLLDSYVGLFAEALSIYIVKSALFSGKEKGGASDSGALESKGKASILGGFKSALRYLIGAGGFVSAIGFAMVSDNPMEAFFSEFSTGDAFEPYANFALQSEAAQLIIPLIIVFQVPNSILSTLFLVAGGLWLLVVALLRYLPAVVFLIAIALSILNLIAFAVTSPFQIANAFSDTGSEAPRKIKQLIVKLVLVLIRFPLVVTGFFLAFEMLESIVPVFFNGLEWVALEINADDVDLSGSIMVMLTTFFFYSFMVLTIFVVSLDCITALHKMTRGFIVSGSGEQVDGASKDIVGAALRFAK